MAPVPVYFELSWSILSTIGAANVFFGFVIASITNFSPIAAVPIVTSAAGSVANGLCYYAFYLPSIPVTNRLVASVFADVLWLVQEAGVSFYSYIILSRILLGRPWYIFAGSFWTIMVGIAVARILIAITRARWHASGSSELQDMVNYMHMVYFPLIALLECVSAYFLLATFAKAKNDVLKHGSKADIFHYLMCSTEVRLALLAVIGVMRAVTYSFQSKPQRATGVAGQVDRFAYTMECLFPIMLYIDLLSSKIVSAQRAYNIPTPSRLGPSSPQGQSATELGGDVGAPFQTSEVSHALGPHSFSAADSGFARVDSYEHVLRG